MPIRKRWTRLTLENVKKLPNDPGAYELANKAKKIIDIGGSGSFMSGVRGRLLSHLRSNKYPTAMYFRCDFTFWESGIDVEASHAEKYTAKHGRKPKYTKRSPRVFRF